MKSSACAYAVAVALAAGLAPAAVCAADTAEPAAAPAVDPLATARNRIAAKRWADAVAELRKVGATGSADWNNLMGYSLRKQANPDLDGAQRHYDAALRIDPRHRGALEYAGELALMRGNLARADEYAAQLGSVCSSPCEELDDLRKAIERFKAAGNRYVP